MLTNSIKWLWHSPFEVCITDTTSQRQRKICILCRPPVPQSVTQAGSFVQKSHMSSSRPETSSTGATGNKETRCDKQWTINPWSGRKQMGSKSNFSPFSLVLGGGGTEVCECGCFICKNLTSNLIIQHLSAALNKLLYLYLSRRALYRCEFLYLTQGGTWSSSRLNLCNWSDYCYFVHPAEKKQNKKKKTHQCV